MIRSGREANYQVGKDTGRFWDAGASNVHWVIVKDDQVAQGITEALSRVEAAGVIVEGNSFLEYIKADLAIMCARSEGGKVKPSARRALSKIDFLYLSTLEGTVVNARRQFDKYCSGLSFPFDVSRLPILTHEDMRIVLSRIYRAERQPKRVINLPQQFRDGEGIQRSLTYRSLWDCRREVFGFVPRGKDAE